MGSSYIGTPLLSQKVTDLEEALETANAAITTNAGDTATLKTWASDRVKYAYPNDGSEGDEKTLTRGSYYVLSSPFGVGIGFSAVVEAYSLSLSEWVVLDGVQYNSANSLTYGVKAIPRNDAGLISIETGQSTLKPIRSWIADAATVVDGLVCRIRCVREG